MSDIYFLFKVLRVKGIGGLMPPDITILGEYGNYYWGKTSNPKKLWEIREFFPVLIDKETAEGLKFIKVDRVPEDPDDPDSPLRYLTDEELELKKKGLKALAKVNIRGDIESQLGDIHDLLADMNKGLCLLAKELFDKGLISQEVMDIFSSYISLFNIDDLKLKLKQKNDIVTEKMKEYMSV